MPWILITDDIVVVSLGFAMFASRYLLPLSLKYTVQFIGSNLLDCEKLDGVDAKIG